MTNPITITNVKFSVDPKAFDYTAWLSCCGTQLISAETNQNSIDYKANSTKQVPFLLPGQKTQIDAPKIGSMVSLSWKLKRDKKEGVDSKTYDKTAEVPIGNAASTYKVELGKIGSISFTGEAPDEAELRRRQAAEAEAKRKEAERIAEEQRRKEESERQEAERIRLEAEQAELAEKARQAAAQQQMAELNARISEAGAQQQAEFTALDNECDYGWQKIAENYAFIKQAEEEEKEAAIMATMTAPPSFPSLNPELRIARLFQEPMIEEEDLVYAAICAQPSAIPPATDSQPDDIYTTSTISPDRNHNNNNSRANTSASRQRSNNNNNNRPTSPFSSSAKRGNNNNNGGISPGRGNNNSTSPNITTVNPNNIRQTPLDVLHDKSNPENLAANDPARQRFGAKTFNDDFGQQEDEYGNRQIVDENDPDYQPAGKFYRLNHEKYSNPLRSFGTSGADDLPPLDSLPKVPKMNHYHRRQNSSGNNKSDNNNDDDVTSNPLQSPKKGVTFSDQVKNNNGASNNSSSSVQEPIYTSNAWKEKNNNNNADTEGSSATKKKGKQEEVRFEMDLEPPPALMTALLHLSRDGGNINATIPIEHQRSMIDSSSPAGRNDNSPPGRSTSISPPSRRNNNNNNRSSVSPAHRHSSPNGENSMTPRRRLPLVYTNLGEVVSKTKRHDDRAVPSFMRQKEIRLQTEDAAQSYWNCFAPQKAKDLVGVRMPASAVTAFEEAASMQIEAASPPRRVTGNTPNSPRNLRTTTAPKQTLRVLDGGESSSHRASRRW